MELKRSKWKQHLENPHPLLPCLAFAFRKVSGPTLPIPEHLYQGKMAAFDLPL